MEHDFELSSLAVLKELLLSMCRKSSLAPLPSNISLEQHLLTFNNAYCDALVNNNNANCNGHKSIAS